MWPFRKNKPPTEKKDKFEIIGVTIGFDLKPRLCFAGGKILYGNADQILYPQYFQDGEWPTDPVTKEKLPIAKL
ncbi:MAG TPA: hypothetical protein VE710_18260 [Candidatus Bathyarchaeia archaeon]|nr:hypothetical protein [Candidatus Bathyarchaeia archaeon]